MHHAANANAFFKIKAQYPCQTHEVISFNRITSNHTILTFPFQKQFYLVNK